MPLFSALKFIEKDDKCDRMNFPAEVGNVFVSKSSWTTCSPLPGEADAPVGGSGSKRTLIKGKQRLRNPLVAERKLLKRIDNEDIQKAARAHKDAHSVHSKKASVFVAHGGGSLPL